ncbi:BamA/TamA family outer membrane protein [Hymenobacter yonginensis]|uniref:Bacterial surface antigen (D15) domain-containing protein n=1 Tax=Hymenobacter yonginensis TaxID=748197 RepID=A0ABY7PPY2_9BACT|nr:hypothetical protein [Hymenobacter yonginensis]WBO84824.1 hypothetical protein O9Z63_00955 [Hymenobacter yonginensis]
MKSWGLFWGILALAWLCLAGPAVAQQAAVAPVDTTRRANGTRPDSLRRRFDQERLLNGLRAYTRRKTIAGKAAAALFNFTPRREDQAGLDAALLDRQYDRHNYKIVRQINIRTLTAFGYSITDSTRTPRNILEKTGNALHIKTSRTRVRQVLLFRVGDELEPQDLAESERLLRQTPELLDARVFVNERTSTADSVDVEIVTKDVFSLNGSWEVRDVGAGIIGLRDLNFMGLGHQFRNSYQYGSRSPQPWSYEGSYQVPFRHFVTGEARYYNEFENKYGGFTISRGFYSINTKYAGALSVYAYDQGVVLPLPDGSPQQPPEGQPPIYTPRRYTTQDVWLGRSLPMPSYDLGYENPARLIVAARLQRTSFSARPTPEYLDARAMLATVGYSVRRYYKDKYLFGFGRTEDIPTGTLLSATVGYEMNSQQNRHYYGVRASTASYSPRGGYLYLSGEFGSFVRRPSNDWQQGLVSTELLYFTRLYHRGNFQWRHFLWSRNAIGLNRRPGEQLLAINGDRGLRGFSPATDLRGTSRVVLNYETTVFTPVSFLGFRLAMLVFADAAWLNVRTPNRTLPFHDKPYTGFGAGLRFRNEYLPIRTFQLLLGFYPRGLATPNGFSIYESSRSYYDFSDFSFGQPGVVRYE